jgi:hypothetical protein
MAVAMTGEARVVGPDDARWHALLERTDPDFYHRPGYVSACAAHEGGQPCALLVEDDELAALIPLILRPCPDGSRDAASPQGYPGILVAGPSDPVLLGALIRRGTETLRQLGVVSLYVRLHPLLNPEPPVGAPVVRHADTIAVDLRRSLEELWQRTRSRFRSQISRAERVGVVVRFERDEASMEVFTTIYHETMTRLEAAPIFHYGDAYFAGLRRALGEALHVGIASVDGEAAAASLFIEAAGIMHLHLAGSDPRFKREHASKLLYHRARTWAKERGNAWLHLGGGRGRDDDGLLHFKAGFAGERTPYRTLRCVVDEDRYRALVAARFPEGDPESAAGFFPAYRAP